MTTKKIAITALLLVGVLSVGVVALLAFTLRDTRAAASKFVSDFAQIEVGTGGLNATEELARTYPDAVRAEEEYIGTNSRDDCERGRCNFAFLFDNRWSRRLRLAPPVWIRANVAVCSFRDALLAQAVRHLEPRARNIEPKKYSCT